MGDGDFSSAIATLLDANVNSAVAVELQCVKLNTKTEVFSQAPGVAQASLTGAFSTRLGEGRYSGYGNPVLTLNGNYYIGENTSNKPTHALLQAFVASSSVKTLTTDVTGSVKVFITGFTENFDFKKGANGMVDYTMTFLQIKDV